VSSRSVSISIFARLVCVKLSPRLIHARAAAEIPLKLVTVLWFGWWDQGTATSNNKTKGSVSSYA
jgi:hypothetical protein